MKPDKPKKTSAAGKKIKTSSDVPRKNAPPKRTPLKIPSILLEGDAPSNVPVGGPGERYALGPGALQGKFPPGEVGELPEAYGTQRLLLTARDPHWIYAHWDLTREQLKEYNAESVDGHLVLRVYENVFGGEPVSQVHVHPESRNWFVHVGMGGTRYVAELGFYGKGGLWRTVSRSTATLTPPDSLSEDTSVRFATIPVDIPFEQLVAIVRQSVRDNVPLAEALLQLRAQGFKNLPGPEDLRSAEWTPAQESALAQVVTMDSVRRVWMGSLEITELIRRQLSQEISSMGAAQFSVPTSPGGAVTSVSSPFGGGERPKGFWFNVNAELIIYGATESNASVTIGGRNIKLRPDGSFSFRFVLPDGEYALPVIATSADGDDSRAAELQFERSTRFRGKVDPHPQDPALKPPVATHLG